MHAFLAAAFAVATLLAPFAGSAEPPALVVVGNPGNVGDAPGNCYSAGCGAIDYVFQMGTYEVTNAQYAAFLNAVADADPNGLYNVNMDTEARGGITRSGGSGSYSYAVKSGRENNPVVFVSFWDAIRYANWLHNGEPTGAQGNATTEDGAYTITSPAVTANAVTRNVGALYWVPSESEWQKAAYYESSDSSYWDYPMQTSLQPTSAPPPSTATAGNYWAGTYALTGSGSFNNSFNYLTDVGAYTSAVGPYGTFDQGGNVIEWTDSISSVTATYRVQRGGGWDDGNSYMSASVPIHNVPTSETYDYGFRIAAPEPGAALAASVAALILAGLRRSRTS